MSKRPLSLCSLALALPLYGCATAPPPQPAQPASEPATVEAPQAAAPTLPPSPKEQLSPEEIRDVVRDTYDQFRACYEAGLARDPKLTGRVTVRVVIDAAGPVREIEVLRAPTTDAPPTDLPDEQAIECMVEVWKQIRFPSAETEVTVVYPIMFAIGDEAEPAQ